MYIVFCYELQAQLLYLYSTLVLVLHFTCTAHLCLLYKTLMYILSFKKYNTNPLVFLTFLIVAGSGPWRRRYTELGSNVKVLGALEPSELSKFYNALDVFVNPILRPQGLDLTLIEAMHCGKPVLTPNYPSIVGTVVVNEGLGYTFSPNVNLLWTPWSW